jgi:hypothetical protein
VLVRQGQAHRGLHRDVGRIPGRPTAGCGLEFAGHKGLCEPISVHGSSPIIGAAGELRAGAWLV